VRSHRGTDDGAVPVYWFTANDDNPGCDRCGTTDAAVRLVSGDLLCAGHAAAVGVVAPDTDTAALDGEAPTPARLWFHLDEVRPLIAHATGCMRHQLTAAQIRELAPTTPALVWRRTGAVDELFSNGLPTWHDRGGDEVTATSHTWIHRPTGRSHTPASRDTDGFFPLSNAPARIGELAGWHEWAPRWAVLATNPLMHWMAVDVSAARLLTGRPTITLHESRGALYPPDAVWQQATVACVPTLGRGLYPALVAADYSNIAGGELARFTRATIDTMIHDLAAIDQAGESMPGEHAFLKWHGADLEVYEVIDTAEREVHRRVDVIRPDGRGLYPLGAHTWPWLPAAPPSADADR
jgi:hypothetical protein